MEKIVTYIPATINPITKLSTLSAKKRKTAGYARVSTDNEEQFTSYEAQVDYYTKYIKGNHEWEFVKVYTDEGITATNTKKRDGFKQMISDALNGKIDLIVTKSVSRFARNTVDSLVTIRKLKEKGVEVYFEKENIWTLDSKGELLLTIMSSLAQEESRSISENVTWGKRKSAADGKVSVAYSSFLGYEKGDDGNLVINENQANIVRRIYHEYMQGKTPSAIANELTLDCIPTPTGKGNKWCLSTINSILSNEKYKGSARLQKSFTVDFLTKKIKKNEGEVPQYYIENNHEPIIPPKEWELVQNEILRRKSIGKKFRGASIFSSRIVCGDCGAYFGSKVWNSTNEKYRRIIWQCNDKFKNDNKCKTPHLSEDAIKQAFIRAFNILFDCKDEIINNCKEAFEQVTDSSALDAKISELQSEIEIITELTHKCIEENSAIPQDQKDYLERYNGYIAKYDNVFKEIQKLNKERELIKARGKTLKSFIEYFKNINSSIIEFDENLWTASIEKVKVMNDKTLIFVFQNGAEVPIK